MKAVDNMDMVPVLRATLRETIAVIRATNDLLQDWKHVEEFRAIHPTLDRLGKALMTRAVLLIDVADIPAGRPSGGLPMCP